jgi:TolA-binding protein
MKTRLGKLMFIVLGFVGASVTSVTNADLVAYWALDGNAKDLIGGSEGVLVGSPVWGVGHMGQALLFDGVDDCVNCGNDPKFDITDEITVAAWIKVGQFDKRWQAIITKGDQAWRLARNNDTDFVNFACTGLKGGNKHFGSTVFGSTPVNDGKWHHVAGVYDGSKICLYVGGSIDGEEASRDSTGKINVTRHDVYIGENMEAKERQFNGLIDDVAVYNHAMTEEEIAQLSKMGVGSFASDPMFQMLSEAVQKGEEMLKEQRPREAIPFLQKAAGEYEELRQKDPNDVTFAHKVLCCDISYLLAKAKYATGAPKGDTVDAYKRAVESGLLSRTRQSSALLWLYENTNADEYGEIVADFIQSGSDYLNYVAAKADTMVGEEQAEAAAKFLEGNLVAYARWREKRPLDEVIAEEILPKIYFQLAKAGEAAQMPKEQVADTYSKTFYPSRFAYGSERIDALKWLVENDRKEECGRAIGLFAQTRNTRACFKNAVREVCVHLESERNWPKFQWFLETLFDKAVYPYEWALFVESGFANKTGRWAEAYAGYLSTNPKLKFDKDRAAAEQYAADERYNEAAELYRSILDRCGPEDDKTEFEYQLSRCLFEAGKFREAIAKLESFVNNNKASHRSRVKEAMLMKGRAHIQLAEMEKAIDAFLTVMIEYPETKEAPETNFFVGYCYMLQAKFVRATDAFNLVVRAHPKSPYAGKARICLTRIKQMTE